MADDIEQRNAFDDLMASRTKDVQEENVFDDLMANRREEQRSRFIDDRNNNEGLGDFDNQTTRRSLNETTTRKRAREFQ